MTKEERFLLVLSEFAQTVKQKSTQVVSGEPEDQLRAPFESLMAAVGGLLDLTIVCTGETKMIESLGRPDFAIHVGSLLAGYAELKAPGVGAAVECFKGHNREQWKRFSAIPNLIYTDGNEWALYRSGERIGSIVRFSGDIVVLGSQAPQPTEAKSLLSMLRDFLAWEPIPPLDNRGRIDLRSFATMIAPLCRMLRADVANSLGSPQSPLVQLAGEWRQLLFSDASDDQFADAYAQTVTFALLLGRSEGADPLTLEDAEKALSADHNLLSRALQVLTDPVIRTIMPASLDLLLRVIAIVPPRAFAGPEDPWLYFYEDFLAVYDPKLRKDTGAYYTPIEVVRAQVRLIDDLLVNRLDKPLGFADPSVVTLDPATGTGTYLLGVIEHALGRVESEQGKGAVAGQASSLAANLYGFELMVGPYAVTELRVSRALRDRGAKLPKDGTHIYLTDTLESPHAEPPQQVMGFAQREFAEQHRRATRIKAEVPVIVCLGNPPYDRHTAVDTSTEASLSRFGGWVRFGDPLSDKPGLRVKRTTTRLSSPKKKLAEREKHSILQSFVKPARDAGHGVHIKNIYNLYVYFWRWALWKVFEQKRSGDAGIVSFITASSYLDGDAFCGMREQMRRLCDEIWIIDIGGEQRGSRKSENVFAIQTPVAIAIAFRSKKSSAAAPAKVRYVRLDDRREDKLAALDRVKNFKSLKWRQCTTEWRAPFKPSGKGQYFEWPLATELMPWQQSGVKAGRTWVIAPEKETLERRWSHLRRFDRRQRVGAFKNSPTGRKAEDIVLGFESPHKSLLPISDLSPSSPHEKIVKYAYRTMDLQYLIADARLIDRPSPTLLAAHSSHQVYLTSLFTKPIGAGPALSASSRVPDLDHFSGRGAKDIIPLYRDSHATEPNVNLGIIDAINKGHKQSLNAEQFFAYVYGLLAHPAFTARFADELETREFRVPITKDARLFDSIATIGARLIWLHTYGERFVPKGQKRGVVPRGVAKCARAVPGDKDLYPESFSHDPSKGLLHVGEGVFAPVSGEVFNFEVSGLKVVQSWLKYRMKHGAGKKSSPLDDIRPERWTRQFTTELLELLWVLEATIEGYPEQASLLEQVVSGPCFRAGELPAVSPELRRPPKAKSANGDLFENNGQS